MSAWLVPGEARLRAAGCGEAQGGETGHPDRASGRSAAHRRDRRQLAQHGTAEPRLQRF